MAHEPGCPRCGAHLRAPGLWSSAWSCEQHGAVHPLHVMGQPSIEMVEHVVSRARVPLWLPWPLPPGWVVTGFAYAGDERSGARATVVACSGPAPLGGAGDLLLVAEEPGVGLGARWAGLGSTDPGPGFDAGPPHAKVEAAGHPTALWCIDTGSDAVAFVGEAKGSWLWTLVWPQDAGVLMYEDLVLRDLRDAGPGIDLPFGALSPRLAS